MNTWRGVLQYPTEPGLEPAQSKALTLRAVWFKLVPRARYGAYTLGYRAPFTAFVRP